MFFLYFVNCPLIKLDFNIVNIVYVLLRFFSVKSLNKKLTGLCQFDDVMIC